MTRSLFLAVLRDAEHEARSAGVAKARRKLSQLREHSAERWVDAEMGRRLVKLAGLCGEQPPAIPPNTPAIGETWLLYVQSSGQSEAVRLGLTEDRGSRAQCSVDTIIRGLDAMASTVQRSLPHRAFAARFAVAGEPGVVIEGDSHGLSASVALLSALTNSLANPSVAGSAQVSSDGRLLSISHLESKCRALQQQWPQVTTVVVAQEQEIPDLEGLAFIRVATLHEALSHFGLAWDALPPSRVDQLEEQLNQCEIEDRTHRSLEQWHVWSNELWALGQRLKTLSHHRTAEAGIWSGLAASHAGDNKLALERLEAIHDNDIEAPIDQIRKAVFLAACCIDVDGERALRLAKAAVDDANALPRHERRKLLGRAQGTYGRALMHQGHLAEAEPFLREAHAFHLQNEPQEGARSACYLACCLRLMGDLNGALSVIDDGLTHALSHADQSTAARTSVMFAGLERGRVLAAQGKMNEALEDLERVIQAQPSTESSYPRLGAHRTLVSVCLAAERQADATRHLEVCLRAARNLTQTTARRVGAVALATELQDAAVEGRDPLLPRADLERVWASCFDPDTDRTQILRTWIY